VLTGSRLARAAFVYLMEPGSLVMERKMLLGIKSRAEGLVREQHGAAASVEPAAAGVRVMAEEPAAPVDSSDAREPVATAS
jgi:hypothetical protein